MSEELLPSSGLPPAGWYADPEIQGRERYWNGTRWTDKRRSPGGLGGSLRRATDDAKRQVERVGTKAGRDAARREKADALEAARTGYKTALAAALRAADQGNVLAEEAALTDATATVARQPLVVREFDAERLALIGQRRLRRGAFLGRIQDLYIWKDRVIENCGLPTAITHLMDERVRASVDTAGNINTTYRPTVGRAGLMSLAGFNTAVSVAWQKKDHHDFRELYFLVEHPDWATVVPVPPDQGLFARQLASAVGVAASGTAQPTTEAGAPSGDDDALEDLKKLGELRDAGVISDSEFEEKKAVLLQRIK